MSFFDKIKDTFNRIKEENKYMARTTARINSNNLYGHVNYRPGKVDPNEDFRNLRISQARFRYCLQKRKL